MVEYFLRNQEGPPGDESKIKAKLRLTPKGIEIGFEGYGEKTMENGHGMPVFIELYAGRPRVIVFGDINQEEPTDIINLANADEKLRKE